MNMQATEQKPDPVELLVQETEQLHQHVERLGDVIGTLALRRELEDDVSELQGVFDGLTSSSEQVAKATLRLSQQREEQADEVNASLAQSAPQPAPQLQLVQQPQEDRRMKLDAKITLLQTELGSLIRDFEGKQRRERAMAALLKTTSILFAAAVVIVLGLRVGTQESEMLLRNVALILSVGILAISAYDTFFDHRVSSMRRSVTLERLKNLRRDLIFSVSSADGQQSEQAMLRSIKQRLDAILQDDMRQFLIKEERASAQSAALLE